MRKENQGIRDAGQFGRVPNPLVVCFLFFVVPGRGVSHTPHKRPDRGGCRMMGRGKIFQACGYIFGKTVFAPCGGTWWAYSIRPYPTGRRCLLFIPTTFTTHPGFFVVRSSFFVRQGRGVLHTPHKTPRQGRVHDDGKGNFFSGVQIHLR